MPPRCFSIAILLDEVSAAFGCPGTPQSNRLPIAREEPARFKKDVGPSAPSQPGTPKPTTQPTEPASQKLVPFDFDHRPSVSNAAAAAMRTHGLAIDQLKTREGRDAVKPTILPILAKVDPRIASPHSGAFVLERSLIELHQPLPDRLHKLHPAAQPNPLLPVESRPPLEDHERAALNHYTWLTDSVINQSLRAKRPIWHPGIAKCHKIIQSAFAKAKPFKTPVVVYRGIATPSLEVQQQLLDRARESYDKNKPLKFDGYVSASTKSSNYFTTTADIEYIIHAKKAIDMRPHSSKAGEAEALLDHGTQVLVHRVYFSNRKNRWVIEGEQVLPADKPLPMEEQRDADHSGQMARRRKDK